MIGGRRGPRVASAAVLGMVAVGMACSGATLRANDLVERQPAGSHGAGRGGAVETVYFSDRPHAPVTLVRGSSVTRNEAVRREVVSFGDGTARPVTVVRGTIDPPAAPAAAPVRQAALAPHKTIEKVDFAGSMQSSVTVVRGTTAVREPVSTDLFGPAGAGELDRIANAVHGAESSYGTDPRMWRPNVDGPQGPMQVSAAAALDVGGGNRFDISENRQLGRAYLARMFRRYGNWPDALAAYNWGPGNVDQWIARGRNGARLPAETVRYIERVLRDALITTVAARRL